MRNRMKILDNKFAVMQNKDGDQKYEIKTLKKKIEIIENRMKNFIDDDELRKINDQILQDQLEEEEEAYQESAKNMKECCHVSNVDE